MCGIAGVVGPRARGEMVAGMLAALRHRGPDAEGLVQAAPGVWFGNRRLAILDLSPAGHMPMAEPDRGCWITYNGELYNFPELRSELEHEGWRFRSRTDTEVILASWARRGAEALRRFRGMFAFAIYDPGPGEVVLARDPLGEKPLYYAAGPGWFAFASEVRALLASGLVARRLDRRAVAVYLHNGFCVDPLTLVEGVRALLPGHVLRVDPEGRVRSVERFWWGPLAETPERAGAREGLRARFEEAVRMRLVADVPLGAFLSGGLDSTAVVGAMARGGAPTRTCTVVLPGSPLDESRWARAVAEHFGADHREVAVDGEVGARVWDALAALDQPSFDGVNTYLVARAAKEAGLTVALSGLGGDELFGGYPFLRHARWLGRTLASLGPARGPLSITAPMAGLSGPRKLLAALRVRDPKLVPLASYQATQALFPEAHARRILEGPAPDVVLGLPAEFIACLREEDDHGRETLDRLSHLALRIFLGQRTLRDTDAVSMAVSLEVRPPFVDRLLVEQAFALPARIRCRGIPDKPFEREVLAPLLPPGHPRRPKQGFVLPFDAWLCPGGALHAGVRERLADRRLVVRAGLRPSAVEALSRRDTRVPWSRLWALVALLDWVGRTGVEA